MTMHAARIPMRPEGYGGIAPSAVPTLLTGEKASAVVAAPSIRRDGTRDATAQTFATGC